MNRPAHLSNALGASFVLTSILVAAGCSSSGDDGAGDNGGVHATGGASGLGGGAAGGAPASGGASAQTGGAGTAAVSGGSPATGGSGGTGPSQGGSAGATGGQSAGGVSASSPGGGAGKGGFAGTNSRCGASCGMGGAGGRPGGAGAGGVSGSAGAAAGAGALGAGGRGGAGAGASGSGGAAAGSGGAGSFEPCPATDPCKILPLGDSITWGINYGGGYRIKLFIHATTDKKNITFVGYDTANPPSSSVLSGLGSASSMWSPKHEGHSGWTIQQDDDLVTGKSTATNDSVSYTGKKVVADFNPNIVLVHLGTNDMHGTTAGAPDRLGTCIDDIVKDAPNALVVVASIIPFPSSASATSTFNKAVPDVVKQRTDAGKHVMYVDMFSALTTSDLGSDQVHPNEGGYEKMAVVWYNAIKTYLH